MEFPYGISKWMDRIGRKFDFNVNWTLICTNLIVSSFLLQYYPQNSYIIIYIYLPYIYNCDIPVIKTYLPF